MKLDLSLHYFFLQIVMFFFFGDHAIYKIANNYGKKSKDVYKCRCEIGTSFSKIENFINNSVCIRNSFTVSQFSEIVPLIRIEKNVISKYEMLTLAPQDTKKDILTAEFYSSRRVP